MSINSVEHHNPIEGGYNIEMVSESASGCFQKGVFQRNLLLILYNVKFHYFDPAKQILIQFGVKYLFLPSYNSELNPIDFCFLRLKIIFTQLDIGPLQ
jgi:hypothetical protein